tara:strand:- start:52 stop:474 length:423 start_codon:yes stop_codon:yes gene_type:complete
MAYKMKKGATAMYGPKAMKEKGAMAYKKGPMAMMNKKGPMAKGVMDADTEDMPVVDREKSTMGASAMMKKKGSTAMMDKKGPMAKSKQRVEQDYARNAIRDYETGKKSEDKYEKKKELEVAAGEGYFSRHKWYHKAFNGK